MHRPARLLCGRLPARLCAAPLHRDGSHDGLRLMPVQPPLAFLLSKLLPLAVYPLGLAVLLQLTGLLGRRRGRDDASRRQAARAAHASVLIGLSRGTGQLPR